MPFYDNFSQVAPSGMGLRLADAESANLLRAIRKHGAPVSVLEIGPGRGGFARACDVHSMDYTCLDISRPLLRALTGRKRLETFAPPIPLADAHFDLAYAANLLEHMPGFRAANGLLEEMARVARPGGLICHRVPNVMAWGNHFWNGDYTHSFPTTPRNVSQAYLDAGLHVEAVYPVSGPVVGRLAYLVSIVGKLIPSFLVDHGAYVTSRLSKSIYSAKTTFLRGFLIVGRKPS